MIINIGNSCSSNYNLLRWLLRRGSPLPIPNREVKPDCADGTAVMWESMSLPFLVESLSDWTGFLVFKRCSAVTAFVSLPFFRSPSCFHEGLLFYNGFGYSELKFAYLTATGSPPFNFKCRGSRLTIPNRKVKPDCADGTAVMWESR